MRAILGRAAGALLAGAAVVTLAPFAHAAEMPEAAVRELAKGVPPAKLEAWKALRTDSAAEQRRRFGPLVDLAGPYWTKVDSKLPDGFEIQWIVPGAAVRVTQFWCYMPGKCEVRKIALGYDPEAGRAGLFSRADATSEVVYLEPKRELPAKAYFHSFGDYYHLELNGSLQNFAFDRDKGARLHSSSYRPATPADLAAAADGGFTPFATTLARMQAEPAQAVAGAATNAPQALPVAEPPPAAIMAARSDRQVDVPQPAVAANGRRRALVIGNDGYRSVPRLANAKADAQAIAASLGRLGFAVTLRTDLDERGFKQALRAFRAEIQGGDEVVVYFAGHGVQLGGSNFLLPVDIRGDAEDQVRDEALPLQRVLDDLAERRAGFMLAIVDACRDNPFKGTGRSIGGRGLAPTTAATGQMIIFSAGSGQQALDRLGPQDKNPNGLFTRVFLQEMEKSDQPVDRVLRNVRSEVVRLARSVGHDQTPALYDQAVGDFYLRKAR